MSWRSHVAPGGSRSMLATEKLVIEVPAVARVVVADTDPALRGAIVDALRGRGHETVATASARAAFDALSCGGLRPPAAADSARAAP